MDVIHDYGSYQDNSFSALVPTSNATTSTSTGNPEIIIGDNVKFFPSYSVLLS